MTLNGTPNGAGSGSPSCGESTKRRASTIDGSLKMRNLGFTAALRSRTRSSISLEITSAPVASWKIDFLCSHLLNAEHSGSPGAHSQSSCTRGSLSSRQSHPA